MGKNKRYIKQSIAYQESTLNHINELKLDDKNFYQIFGYEIYLMKILKSGLWKLILILILMLKI